MLRTNLEYRSNSSASASRSRFWIRNKRALGSVSLMFCDMAPAKASLSVESAVSDTAEQHGCEGDKASQSFAESASCLPLEITSYPLNDRVLPRRAALAIVRTELQPSLQCRPRLATFPLPKYPCRFSCLSGWTYPSSPYIPCVGVEGPPSTNLVRPHRSRSLLSTSRRKRTFEMKRLPMYLGTSDGTRNRYDSKSFQVAPVCLMSLVFGLTKSRRSAACAWRLDSSVR